MPILHRANSIDGNESCVTFWCPGCKCIHYVRVPPHPYAWKFNEDMNKPTFSPSIKVTSGPQDKRTICHSFITDGKIHYCNDSTHELSGKTVDMEEWKDG